MSHFSTNVPKVFEIVASGIDLTKTDRAYLRFKILFGKSSPKHPIISITFADFTISFDRKTNG